MRTNTAAAVVADHSPGTGLDRVAAGRTRLMGHALGLAAVVTLPLQAAGVATWAATYFVATDPEIGSTAGRTVIEAANADDLHLYGLIFPGVVLVTLGTVGQCFALFRAKATPAWVPVGLLFVVVTFVIQSTGPIGLICTIPMTIGALGLAAAVIRSTREQWS